MKSVGLGIMTHSLRLFMVWILFYYTKCDRNYNTKCNILDPPAVPHIQEERLRGPWYGLFFKSGRTVPFPLKLRNFVQDFIVFGKEIESRITGRRLENPDDCLYETSIQAQMGESGRFNWTSNVRYEGRVFDWRIIDINFREGYLVRWACLEFIGSKCNDFEVAVWNRRPNPLRPNILRKVQQVVRDVFCLDLFTDFIQTRLENYCPSRPGQIVRIPIQRKADTVRRNVY